MRSSLESLEGPPLDSLQSGPPSTQLEESGSGSPGLSLRLGRSCRGLAELGREGGGRQGFVPRLRSCRGRAEAGALPARRAGLGGWRLGGLRGPRGTAG